MFISEAIKKLEDFKNEYGNLELRVFDELAPLSPSL